MTTTEVTTTTNPTKKEQRVCSECDKNFTRIHYWNKNQLRYEQWYNDHRGGWFCYSCYMKKYWEKRKQQEGQINQVSRFLDKKLKMIIYSRNYFENILRNC